MKHPWLTFEEKEALIKDLFPALTERLAFTLGRLIGEHEALKQEDAQMWRTRFGMAPGDPDWPFPPFDLEGKG